jgi:hypothetical protein
MIRSALTRLSPDLDSPRDNTNVISKLDQLDLALKTRIEALKASNEALSRQDRVEIWKFEQEKPTRKKPKQYYEEKWRKKQGLERGNLELLSRKIGDACGWTKRGDEKKSVTIAVTWDSPKDEVPGFVLEKDNAFHLIGGYLTILPPEVRHHIIRHKQVLGPVRIIYSAGKERTYEAKVYVTDMLAKYKERKISVEYF